MCVPALFTHPSQLVSWQGFMGIVVQEGAKVFYSIKRNVKAKQESSLSVMTNFLFNAQ